MRFSLFLRHCILAIAFLGISGLSCATNAQTGAPDKRPQTGTLLIVGDSLSAEYGLKRGTGWVALLEQRLTSENKTLKVVNASISGETTAGGASRLEGLLKAHQPSHVVVELGGNDALRGLPLKTTQDNLTQMTRQALHAGARVVLVGMELPPNYGLDYTQRFKSVFKTVAESNKIELVPFLLKGVGDVPDAARLFQADRIHPNEVAQPIMLDNVWPALKKILK